MIVALSVVSLVIALFALLVNMSGIVRRPRIAAQWGPVQDEPSPSEGLAIVVTARRRPIEVDEIGIVFLPGRARWMRQSEWMHEDVPFRLSLNVDGLPKRLEDGQSARAFIELDYAIDRAEGRSGVSYPYVLASGTVYLARDTKLRDRLRRQSS